MRIPKSAHNRLTYAGALVVLLAVSAGAFLVVFTELARGDAPYGSLIIFLMLPAFILVGLLLIPIGMWREHRYIARTGHSSIESFPVFDLNDPLQRLRFVLATVVGLALLFAANFGSYLAYEETESVSFCGQTCHVTMEPEAVAHQGSPHARTSCVACHVGPGSDAFIQAKVSGLRQVYEVLFDKVPKPIPVPIENLRPATETCQTCHWPEQYYVPQYRRFVHFMSDEKNTRWEIHLRLMTGGGGPHLAGGGGIHAHHSGVNKRIEYFATDRERNDIPWLRVTDRESGLVTEYLAKGASRPEEAIAGGTIRTMDCIDCHNRPAHRYEDPDLSMNVLMAVGTIDPSLPDIKKVGLEVLKADYETTPEAIAKIADEVQAHYRTERPDVLATRNADLSAAIGQLQDIYRRNFFPRMKVRWDTYPDHSAHLTSPGCFRCHDGAHVSEANETLTNDCRTCHAIVAQGNADTLEHATDVKGLDFAHPGDIGDAWQGMACADCHGAE
jgi:nitrate/TMAO reductase-like tetraheme cytochrome c subunit